jgi:hypothetical protein
MAFKYACFISYCPGQHEMVKGFVDQLETTWGWTPRPA